MLIAVHTRIGHTPASWQGLRSQAGNGELPPRHASRSLDGPSVGAPGATPVKHQHPHRPPLKGLADFSFDTRPASTDHKGESNPFTGRFGRRAHQAWPGVWYVPAFSGAHPCHPPRWLAASRCYVALAYYRRRFR